MDNDFFGIYDESFDLDRDGKLDAVEFDYMMEELDKASNSSISGDDDSYLLDYDVEDEDKEDDWDDEEDDSQEDYEDEDDWDDSDDDDWNGDSDDY